MREELNNIPDDWMIDSYNLTDEQRDIINDFDCSFIVEGPAGSGKTVIATYKYIDCIGNSKISETAIFVYTKALSMFIKSGLDKAIRQGLVDVTESQLSQIAVNHIDEARGNIEERDYKYIIIDEAQDFLYSDFDLAFSNCKKVMIFGDDDQKLYDESRASLLEIKEMYKNEVDKFYRLTDHYRTPRKIIEYASKIINKPEIVDFSKSNDYDTDVDIRKFKDTDDEIKEVAKVIKQYNLKKVGIFVNRNESIENVINILGKNGIECNSKIYNKVSLNFNQTNKPTILTYHSAKGVQFENVFVVHCGIDEVFATPHNDKDNYQKALYVSCTRTTKRLFIFYKNKLNVFMENIR